MVLFRSGGSGEVAGGDLRLRSGAIRPALIHLAAAVLLVLAPMACSKDSGGLEDGQKTAATASEQTGGGEDAPDTRDRDIVPLASRLDGLWQSGGGPDECMQLEFELGRPDRPLAYFQRPGDMTDDFFDLYRLDDDGLAGRAIRGGPYPECGHPSMTTRFFAKPTRTASLEVRWLCTSADGGIVRDETLQYERGMCPGRYERLRELEAQLPYGETEAPQGDGTDDTTTPPGEGDDDGLGGTTTGGTSNADSAETVVDNVLTTGTTAGCVLAGTWRQSTVDVGATSWDITASGQATETGIGYAKGTATLTGQTLRIDWTTTNGFAGYYQWRLDSDCKSGSGNLVFSAGRTGSFSSIVTR